MSKVVIIGGSYAGLIAVSVVAKHDPLASITLISPSTHAYFNVAAPRLVVQPELEEKTVFAVEDIVQDNSNGKGTFILGSATKVVPESNLVHYSSTSGESGEINYDFLIVASGTQTAWAGFKTNLDYTEAQKEIKLASSALKTAKKVAIIGGGPTGVETAGEIANEYPDVEVDLYTGHAVLAGLPPSLGSGANEKLKKLGVNVISGVYVKRVSSEHGRDSLVVEKGPNVGTETAYDLILECYVTKPYSEYLPESIKDKKGYVVTNKALLVEGHSNIAAFGDIVSGSGSTIVDIKMGQKAKLTQTFQKWVNGGTEPKGFFPYIKSFFSKPASDAGPYQPVDNTYVIPISRNGGVGILFDWGVPNFVVYFVKAKSFMIETARTSFQP